MWTFSPATPCFASKQPRAQTNQRRPGWGKAEWKNIHDLFSKIKKKNLNAEAAEGAEEGGRAKRLGHFGPYQMVGNEGPGAASAAAKGHFGPSQMVGNGPPGT